MFRIIAIAAVTAAAAAGCSMPAVRELAPAKAGPTAPRFNHTDPADDCRPGAIVIESGENVDCDLVGGSNTLTVIDVDQDWCDQSGGTWTPLAIAGECANVDF